MYINTPPWARLEAGPAGPNRSGHQTFKQVQLAMSQQTKRVAAVQMDVAFADVDHNVQQILAKIATVKADGVDLAVFPECALTGYCFESREEALPLGLSIDDLLFDSFAAACGDSDLHVIIGFLEIEGDKLFNSQAMINRSGVVGSYRKIHLPGVGVDRFLDPGDREFSIQAAGEIRVGMAICYDSSFPETARVLGLHGADVIALSTNWPVAARRTAEIVPPARSMENHLYFIAANRVGTERTFEFCGMSSIAGPDGVMIAETDSDQELILTADIDLSIARNKQIVRTPGKHVIDRFADRHPERYTIIGEKK